MTKMKELGLAVRAARFRKDWTVEKLAKVTGYSKSMISQCENSMNSISIEGLVRLARVLQFDLEQALGLRKWRTCKRCHGTGRIEL